MVAARWLSQSRSSAEAGKDEHRSMSRLSRNEIFEAEENAMATIHPPANGVSYNSEEQAANTWNGPKRTELTPEQLVARDAELRAKAPQNPNSYSARAAAAAAERAARRAESQKQ